MSNIDTRTQALNLALTYHRQANKAMKDDEIVEVAEKFRDFLVKQ